MDSLDLSKNPVALLHELDFHLHSDSNNRKANLWAFIAANAHSVDYDYNRIVHFIDFVNTYKSFYVDARYWIDLSVPSPLEYLEILEFVFYSYKKQVLKIKNISWEWPSNWGKVIWNTAISYSFRKHDRNRIMKDEDETIFNGETEVQKIKMAIEVFKFKLGHNQPVQLTVTEKLLISVFLNFFISIDWVKEIPQLPSILLSLDLPPLISKINNSNARNWNTDGLLGLYVPGRDCKIILYERGIEECSMRLKLPKLAIRELTIIHEIAHWISDQLPLGKCSSSYYERWSDIEYKSEASGFEKTETAVHECWAQLLTYYSLLATYTQRSEPFTDWQQYFKENVYSPIYIFLKLNEQQSSDYKAWRDIITFGKPVHSVIGSIRELREYKTGASLEYWKEILLKL